MRVFVLVCAIVAFLLFSCQKEIENENNTSGSLLVKTVSRSGSDSLITTYAYDANQKLINKKTTGIDVKGVDVNREYRIYRNASGIVTNYSVIDADLISVGIDSLATLVHYDATLSKYTSSVTVIGAPGYNFFDSTVFSYDGSGRIIAADLYDGVLGSSWHSFTGKEQFAYSPAGNMAQHEIKDVDQSVTIIPISVTNFSYDDKLNPLHLGNEGIVLKLDECYSLNNIVTEIVTDNSDPSGDQTETLTYAYNDQNRPTIGQLIIMPNDLSATITYYYQ